MTFDPISELGRPVKEYRYQSIPITAYEQVGQESDNIFERLYIYLSPIEEKLCCII